MQSNGWCGKIRVSQTTNYTYDHSGRLVRERTTSIFTNGGATNKSITYLYDCSTIVGMILNGVKYFFQRNIQGDVVGVYDSTGTKVVGFRYDAFGRCTVIGDVNLAQWCKIRYRGYYYDTETGLYWVQTRYYNPDWCRWISSDSISYLDPESPHGLNLYLYCGNDPVNLSDPSGCSGESFWDWINTIFGLLNPVSSAVAIGGIIGAAIGGRWDDVVSDYNNGCLNPFNQSEDVALMTKVVGFYKGSTIIKQDLIGTCSAFGTIWANAFSDPNTVKHEYGHSIQERILGISYWTRIAIPSMLYYEYDKKTNGTSVDYFSTPWEYSADQMGGVKRNFAYKQNSLKWSIAENILGPVVILLYFLFGY